jgi:hypothetical protein
MISVRYWSVRNARFLEWFYQRFESSLVFLHPVFKFIGYDRVERPMAKFEKWIKGFMFDCQMCGQCVLSSTGMSCPMNCPKQLRNGPCGGVRPDGNCEVKPNMRCVWIEGIEGSSRMRNGESIRVIQIAVDHRLQGRSSWLRVVKQHFGVQE